MAQSTSRLGIVWMVMVLTTVPVVVAGQTPERISHPDKIPDLSYHPKRGDRAALCFYNKNADRISKAEASKYAFVYEEYWKSMAIKDYDGVRELTESGRVIEPDIGTEVLVLEIEEFPAKDPRADCAIVRIMEGQFKGTKVWVDVSDVNRLVKRPKSETQISLSKPEAIPNKPSHVLPDAKLLASKEKPQKEKTLPPVDFTRKVFAIDYSYVPEIGDEAILATNYKEGTLAPARCAKSLKDLGELNALFYKARGNDERDAVWNSRRWLTPPIGTIVSILKVERAERQDLWGSTVEVSVLNGPLKGQHMATGSKNLLRIAPDLQAYFDAVDPSVRTYFARAQGYENDGRPKDAIDWYRRVVTNFRSSLLGEAASRKIAALMVRP